MCLLPVGGLKDFMCLEIFEEAHQEVTLWEEWVLGAVFPSGAL